MAERQKVISAQRHLRSSTPWLQNDYALRATTHTTHHPPRYSLALGGDIQTPRSTSGKFAVLDFAKVRANAVANTAASFRLVRLCRTSLAYPRRYHGSAEIRSVCYLVSENNGNGNARDKRGTNLY